MIHRTESAPRPIPVPPAPFRVLPSERPLRTVRQWLRSFGPLGTILDVGCSDSPAATWGAFRKRYSIDPRPRPELPCVYTVRGLFPEDWRFGQVDVALCLDTLPGLVNPYALAQALLAVAERVILSVALVRSQWLTIGADKGRGNVYEIQQPNPLATVESWFSGRAAAYSTERTDPPRLICLFARPLTLVIGQRVYDRRTNHAYRFERWIDRRGHRYAQVTNAAGDRHQLAEQFLRAG